MYSSLSCLIAEGESMRRTCFHHMILRVLGNRGWGGGELIGWCIEYVPVPSVTLKMEAYV